MEAGAEVWVYDPNADDAWILSEVTSRSETELNLFQVSKPSHTFTRPRVHETLEDGSEVLELQYEGVKLANNKLSDEEKAEGKDDDMITLPHLHEPAILHAIGGRFAEGKIYTWTGPVLIAVNPFQRLPLYTNEILEKYRREGLLRSQGMQQSGSAQLGPHVYAIADLSYRQMMAPKRRSQAILISGESGAGKTESTKIVMLYLTTLGTVSSGNDSKGKSGEDLSVMERVLQSNPILEAFGNARTLRNDNSSRFGKFIELGFSRAGHLLGAKVQTYLLEKVRLGFHASGERNYHIFYQLLRGASEEQKKKYGFHDGDTGGLELANYFHFTGQGGAPNLREFTDEDGLKYTLKAMTSLGWDDSKINTVLSLVAGLLHLGQVTFHGIESDEGEIAQVADESILLLSASLLGVSEEKLKAALTQRILITRGEAITIKLPPEKSVDARDALAKTIYGALFLWIVSEVNKSVIWIKDSEVRSSVGVLDIFGFECFAVNSFEQICINFTNEALQQQFNKFIFKMEQAEYEREDIVWDFIAFPDNQDCLDMIQSRPNGILAMLDDECRLGARGNDKNWADRLYKQNIPNKDQVESENSRFSATPIMKSRSEFHVKHFAGPVKYTATTGFLEKNKDEIPVTAQNLFESSESWLIKNIYAVQKAEVEEGTSSNKPGKPAKSKTVSQQFKEQLSILIEKIESTEPHYIRCLKPNDAAKPNLLTRRRLTEQLRYGGVLEAVRVARMGFPVRLNHREFFQEYRMLLPTISGEKLSWQLEGNEAQALCVSLVDILLEEGKRNYSDGVKSPNEEGISRSEKIRRMQLQPIPMVFPRTDVQLGASKVFMRKPAHDALEAHRVFHQTASATILQAWIRGMQKRIRHLILCDAILTVQRFYRGCKGRERWWKLRELVAGNLLTKAFRMLITLRRFYRAKKGTIIMQATYRGHAGRRVLATRRIQTYIRMRNKLIIYCKLKSATVALQCRQRCGTAKKILISLKYEQKDIGKLKQNNEKLKLEMASLKAMLAAQAQGTANKEESKKEMKQKEEEIKKLEKRIHELEVELEKEKVVVKKLESDLENERINTVKNQEEILLLKQRNKEEEIQSPSSPVELSPISQHRDSWEASPPRRETPHSPIGALTIPCLDGLQPPSQPVNPVALAKQKKLVERLERELTRERQARRDADGEVIKLRAKMNGVQLNENDVDALLPTVEGQILPTLSKEDFDDGVSFATETTDSKTEAPEDMSTETPRSTELVNIEQVSTTEKNIETDEEKFDRKMENVFRRIRSPREFLPIIKRGMSNRSNGNDINEENVVERGWKVEVTSRKEREESLRNDVHRFEVKMKNLYSTLEQGGEVSMWQCNKPSADDVKGNNDFSLTNTPVKVQLQQRGRFLVQAVLTFTMAGGYFSKALNRRRMDKNVLDPLSLNEILEVKAGCDGYDPSELPTKGRAKKLEKNFVNLFLTLKAAPTPIASSRLYFLKFKSRSSRNDLLMGLRGLLADLQINEGVGISSMQNGNVSNSNEGHGKDAQSSQDEDVLIPLSEVRKAIDQQRASYDRLLLLMLQGASDQTDKENDLMSLQSKLDGVVKESKEKDKVQANDSKLIMQLSKKLESLLMDNEDLREQNEILNNHVVALSNNEKANYSF